MDKLNMHTPDITDSNIQKIAELFPNCLTERLDENGKPEVAIDFDKLKQELSKEIVEGNQERYQFTWPGKREAMRLANTPTNMTLRPCREDSVDFDNTENLYIEGDNLEVLKLLRENYLGKVKMIYIDPPYNTGNDFVYNDDYRIENIEFKSESGNYDEYGNLLSGRMQINTESNGRFHTDWLNMMYPRLKVARDLLTDDGVIFISIDDNEVENLKKICDEVFGESNILYSLSVVNNLNGNDNSHGMMETHEYCLIYAKNKDLFSFGVLPLEEDEANDWFQDEIGFWKVGRCLKATGINAPREARPNLFYTVYVNEKTLDFTVDEKVGAEWYHLIPLTDGREMSWYWSKETMERDKNEVIVRKTSEGYSLYKKQRPQLGDLPSKRGKTTFYSPKYANANSNAEVKSLFDGKKVFDYTKATYLIKDLISLANTNKDSFILDFFSGSATTAHAVMQLNAEDGGKRKFIIVQLPEKTDENSEAYKAGYKNICEIGKERIRRAGKKIKEESGLMAENLDTGFRVLKLDTSNMEDVYYKPEEFSELQLFEDNVKPDRTPEDLLFQVMLECNLPLSAKIEKKTIAGKEVFNVNEGYLIACFDKDVNEEVITEVAKQQPYYFIMRDSSLSSDNVADNFEQIFNAYSKDTIRKIL